MSTTGTELAPKTTTRIAMLSLSPETQATLTDCFKQFKIATVSLGDDGPQRVLKEKFEGCVVRLDDNSSDLLKTIRSSPSNRALVLYAIADHRTAMKYSEFGINAVIAEPVDRSLALKMVRGTYLLAVHEFRRYVRVPVAVAVEVDVDGQRISALSQEISSGGMSLQSNTLPGANKMVNATFTLPGAKAATLRAQVCWQRENQKSFGLRFDGTDPNRPVVRGWIESFLDQH